MHLMKSVHTSSPLNTIAEQNELRYFSLFPHLATALAQNVLPRLNLIITAANTMALNSTSRLFEGCRLHHHHNPLHLVHSITDRQRGQSGEGGRKEVEGQNEGRVFEPRLVLQVINNSTFAVTVSFFFFISYSI